MSAWDEYPLNYRAREVEAILRTTQAGECVSIVGLSGAGKSNLIGFVAHRNRDLTVKPDQAYLLIDCNRLAGRTATTFFRAIRRALDTPFLDYTDGAHAVSPIDEFEALDVSLTHHLDERKLALLFDRFDDVAGYAEPSLFNNLRALRDAHKFALTYVTATRHPLNHHTELAELFYANTIWLGPLSESDARWNVARYAARKQLIWDNATASALIEVSRGYPSLLRAACEAHASGASLDLAGLAEHPAVKARVSEFWNENPSDEALRRSGLWGHPLLMSGRVVSIDTSQLTAKEHLLLKYFQAHPNEVCEKDDLIRAVWPEDKVYERGIRDDSLAQIVRRLREKIEPDPAAPRYILTVPGRGYRFVKQRISA